LAKTQTHPAADAPAASPSPRARIRRHPRVALDLPGVYTLPSQGWRRWLLTLLHPSGPDSLRAYTHTPCRVLNLGLGGARLQLEAGTQLCDGQHLLLGIVLAGGALIETIEAEVLEVADASDHGTFVRVLFHPMDPGIQVQLGRLINAFQAASADR